MHELLQGLERDAINPGQSHRFSTFPKGPGNNNTLKNNTVNPVLSGFSKIDKTKILMTNGSLMNVKSIAECSPWSILQYF